MNLIEKSITGLCRVLLWITTLVIFAILVSNTVLRYATGSSLQWANGGDLGFGANCRGLN